MALPIFRNAGALLVETIAQGATVSYLHKATNERVDIVGFYKDKMSIKDPISGRTEIQKAPRFRLANVPWTDADRLVDDEITDADGKVWYVTAADIHSSGSVTVEVTATKRRR